MYACTHRTFNTERTRRYNRVSKSHNCPTPTYGAGVSTCVQFRRGIGNLDRCSGHQNGVRLPSNPGTPIRILKDVYVTYFCNISVIPRRDVRMG